MDALERLMRPVARLLNRNIEDSIQARERVSKMNGRVVAIEVSGTDLAVFFVFDDGVVELKTSTDRDADATVSGSLPALVRLAASGSDDLVRAGSIRLEGDATTAQDFQRLLKLAQPDLEEELANVIGDPAAHGIGEFARGFLDWGRRAGETMAQNVREYLQEESREVPTRDEVESFRRKVNTLRDDVDRLEARIRQLTDVET